MTDVIKHNKLQKLDNHLFYKCNLRTSNELKQIAVWVSKSGDGYLYFILALFIWFNSTALGQSFFNTALLAFAIELPIYLCLKNLIKRNRPFDKLTNFKSHIAPSDKFSMPSGHTAAAFVFATCIQFFFPEFAILAYFWACLIGFSRVLLGVHFPTDIIAGALLGYASAELAISFMVF